jgi:arabinofuranan 3-O-arabinosyltransferase
MDLALAGVLAGLSYLPVFLSQPGRVAADTKQYLYLDPGRLTTRAASMWDPNTGLGTVTHQNIGYLLPMGPYYSLISWLGIPMWVGQRIWMGSLMLAAGTGVAYCARRLGLEGAGRGVAAVAYTLTPYILDYLDRISAILMPWAALGWLVGLSLSAVRTGRWRHPARFALVVALVGGVNATSILLVLAAPAVVLVHTTWVSREVTLRRALATGGRIAVLCTLVSVWWAAGLWAEGRYGINVLRVTETVPTVSSTSSAAEVLRGLGYWYFYGWDKVQPWTQQSLPYTQSAWLVAVSFAGPAVAVLLGLVTRWVYRSLCLVWVGVGTVVAVGAFPFAHPSLFGAAIKGASAGSTIALAMRSVDRIVPMVVLGLALLMGSGVTAIYLRRPGAGLVAGGMSLVLVGANLPSLWTGGLIASNLTRPSQIPSYWTAAADYLNQHDTATRVLGLPGEDFGAYSWGVTADPVPPGLLDRPYVSRMVVPAGTPASADLVRALDEPIQEGTLYPPALAPMARLMGVGQILLQSDLQYERYHLPLPQVLYPEITSADTGLGAAVNFGAPNPAPQIRYPLWSELRLGIPTGTPEPPALSVLTVGDPRALARTESAGTPIVLAGDGSGVVEAAGAGLLGGDEPILYAADTPPIPTGATLVLTDTNPLATARWGSLRDNGGEVQVPGTPNLDTNPSDYTLPVFPGETTADQTVAQVGGLDWVTASQYGDSLSFTPENRPFNAFDGNTSTAWTFGAHEAVAGIRLDTRLATPVTTDHVVLHQVRQLGQVKRRITGVTLRFDGRNPVNVALTSASLGLSGQTVSFPAHTFSDFELTVNGATLGAGKRYDGLPQVGFTEISIPGVGPASEALRLPTDLSGPDSDGHPLDVLMNRQRAIEPPRHDPEPAMRRTFDLSSSRTFSVAGTAEVNSGDSDYLIDQLVGLIPPPAVPPGQATVVTANSSTRLDEDRAARANAALDGNPATAWIAETGPQSGEWLQLGLSQPASFDHLDLQVLNDGRHSLPSRITISTPAGSRTVDLADPPVGTGRPANSTSLIPVTFPALTGSNIRLTVDAVRPVRALDYYSTYAGLTDIMPVGIAELGLPGVVEPATPAQVPAVCSTGLLQIDGRPIDLEVTGRTEAALGGAQLALRPCGNSARGVVLGPGRHTVTTSPRLPLGWSIDQLWLGSDANGSAAPVDSTTGQGPQAASPPVTVRDQNRTSMTLSVQGTGRPFWLVLGQSFNSGWQATVGGHSLGAPRLIDGYANGWYVPARAAGQPLVVHLTWAPQRVVWIAIGTSAAAVLLCLVLARASRRRLTSDHFGAAPEPASWSAFLGRVIPGPPPAWPSVLAAGAVFGLAAAAVSRPATGVIAGVMAVVAGRWPGGRILARAAALVALAALPIYSVAQQLAHHYYPSIDWPASFSSANDLAWLGLALLGSDLVAGAVYARRTMRAPRRRS